MKPIQLPLGVRLRDDATFANYYPGANAAALGYVERLCEADAGWTEAVRAVSDLAAGKGKRVEPVQSNGKTLYRGYVTGFGSRAEATTFCERLKSTGRSCFVR